MSKNPAYTLQEWIALANSRGEFLAQQATEIERLRARVAELETFAHKLYPYMERLNHFHLPDGTVLYASKLWDLLQGADLEPRNEV